jgi:hypothetical protein
MPKTSSWVATFTTIANTPILVAPENPNRVVVSGLNLSDTEMFFGYSQDVSTTGKRKGWRIAPGYGTFEDEFAKDPIYIICSADDKEITIAETTKVE